MAYSPAKIRVIGRDCINKYNAASGERTIQEIVEGLGMTQENTDLVLAFIYLERPDLKPVEEGPEEPQAAE